MPSASGGGFGSCATRARPSVSGDLDRLCDYIDSARAGRNRHAPLDPIPTVAHNGDTVVCSPELLGVRDPDYSDFLVGNVLTDTIGAMLARARQHRYVREFEQALQACATGCDYFDFCQGAQAATATSNTAASALPRQPTAVTPVRRSCAPQSRTSPRREVTYDQSANSRIGEAGAPRPPRRRHARRPQDRYDFRVVRQSAHLGQLEPAPPLTHRCDPN
jgi:hypothetical protein